MDRISNKITALLKALANAAMSCLVNKTSHILRSTVQGILSLKTLAIKPFVDVGNLAFVCLFFLMPIDYAHGFNDKESKEPNPTLRVAVAANFTPILEKLLPEFQRLTNIQTQIISGASGTFYQQISHGAPFDVFLSADDLRPIALEEQQLIVQGSRETYAIGQLALWSAVKDVSSLKDMAEEVKRFAIANPRIAPYGRAAKEAMQHFGVWQKLSPKLVTGINVGQTFQQVRSKAVEIGIVAHSQLVLNGYSGLVLPQQSHQPIMQQLVILKSSKHVDAALEFKRYMLSSPVQEKISQYGYYKNVL